MNCITDFSIELPADTQSDGVVFSVESLMTYLAQVPDPRKARGVRYSVVTLLTLLIMAKLCGQDEMKGIAEWVQLRAHKLVNLLSLKRKTVPHQTTYERLLERLDIEEFERLVGAYFAQQARQTEGELTVSIDGKVLRGTIPEGQTQGVHLLAAYVPERGIVLMQVEVEAHMNELSTAPRLLEVIDLNDIVVTGDAMFTNRDLCEQIVLAGGNYVFPVKDNQPSVRKTIAEVFMPSPETSGHGRMPISETLNSGHGRIEQRYLTVTDQLNDYLDWPHVKQVFRLQRVIHHQKTGKITYQVVFGVTSLSSQACSPQRLMKLIRQHWHIENRLHFVRDVTFGEDDCTIRETKRQRALACLNNLIIGLIRQTDFAYVPEARRFFDANYQEAFNLLL